MDIEFRFKKIGGSQVIFIPKIYADKMNIQDGDHGMMRLDKREKDNKIFLATWKKGE
jgi:antitoxin component of MazEF toxin-antitoxin module